MSLSAPFPYIGGKSTVSKIVWARYGNTHTYVEPFAGSLAVLLGRPADHLRDPKREIVNDYSGHVVNAWRSMMFAPQELAIFISEKCPVFEVERHAKQKYLISIGEDLREKLTQDTEYFDLRSAAYWISGLSSHILAAGFPDN